MSDSKKTDNDGVAVKTKDRPPKITSSKSTGEITIKHRKIEKKDKVDAAAKDGSATDRTEKDKDKKEKKEKKKSSDPSKKDKKKRDSFRLSKSLVDPKDESKTTSTSDDHKQSPHTIGTPHPLTNSLSSPSIKAMESSSGSKSGGHSRHSSNDTSNTNSTPRKKTPRSPRIDALKESEDADEHTDEDKQTIATLKQKRDQFIRTISSRHVQLPMHVKAVFSETIEESDEESSSSGMDWEDPNFELQIDQQIKELGEPLPEETTLLSNLQSMLKIPTWKNDDWIQTLQEEKDRIEKDKRKSLNTDQIETQVGGRRTSLGPMSSPAGSRSTIEGPAGRSNRASSGSSKLGVMKAKVGYVLQKSKLGPWKRRYLILDDTRLTAKKSPMEMKAKLVVPMLFSQCKSIDKPLSGKRKLYMFEIFTPDTKFLMATDSQQSTLDWVTAIQKACDNQMLQSLDLQENANGHDKEDLKPEVKELLEIMKLPGNNICTDCDAADPEWAVINIGNFVCIDCSGVHRALGVQVSKVRSIYLDNWEPEAVAYMRTMGNKKVNEIWENKVPSYREKPKQNATREKRMFWIVSKYVKKEFFDWSRAGEAKVDPENHQSISNTVLAAKMIPNDMAELKKAILNLVKEDDSFRKQMKDLIFGDNEMRQVMDSESSANNTSVSASKDKGRTRATTTTGL